MDNLTDVPYIIYNSEKIEFVGIRKYGLNEFMVNCKNGLVDHLIKEHVTGKIDDMEHSYMEYMHGIIDALHSELPIYDFWEPFRGDEIKIVNEKDLQHLDDKVLVNLMTCEFDEEGHQMLLCIAVDKSCVLKYVKSGRDLKSLSDKSIIGIKYKYISKINDNKLISEYIITIDVASMILAISRNEDMMVDLYNDMDIQSSDILMYLFIEKDDNGVATCSFCPYTNNTLVSETIVDNNKKDKSDIYYTSDILQ